MINLTEKYEEMIQRIVWLEDNHQQEQADKLRLRAEQFIRMANDLPASYFEIKKTKGSMPPSWHEQTRGRR